MNLKLGCTPLSFKCHKRGGYRVIEKGAINNYQGHAPWENFHILGVLHQIYSHIKRDHKIHKFVHNYFKCEEVQFYF